MVSMKRKRKKNTRKNKTKLMALISPIYIRVNNHFYPSMCNLLTNASLKNENTKFSL